MNQRLCVTLCGLFAFVMLSGCTGGHSSSADAKVTAAPATPSIDEQLNEQFNEWLLEIAEEYLSYGLIDPTANLAPVACDAPPGPPSASYSHSEDNGTHGRKLYYLFAAKPESYLSTKRTVSPVDQVLVKESWHAKAVEPPGLNTWVDHASGEQVMPFAFHGGDVYQVGEKGPLFVMFKLAPETPGTDQGWVYGTLTPDGSQVTAVGKIQSCMDCHVESKHDRLFGLPSE